MFVMVICLTLLDTGCILDVTRCLGFTGINGLAEMPGACHSTECESASEWGADLRLRARQRSAILVRCGTIYFVSCVAGQACFVKQSRLCRQRYLRAEAPDRMPRTQTRAVPQLHLMVLVPIATLDRHQSACGPVQPNAYLNVSQSSAYRGRPEPASLSL